jgi:DNA-binding transcriptional MocR family regulator
MATSKLYESVADHIAEMIRKGVLSPGDRVPSVRRTMRQQGVSMATVAQAYALLEARGFVEARARSGHYVASSPARVLDLPRGGKGASVPVSVQCDQLVGFYRAMGNPRTVPLGAATPGPQLLPTERLNRIAARIARSAGGVGAVYDPLPGFLPLRREIARRVVAAGCSVTADEIITTSGAIEALHLSLRAVTRPGDTVGIEAPTHFGVIELLGLLGLKALELPCHPETGVDPAALEVALQSQAVRACVLVPNFSNPLGTLMPDAHKRWVVEQAASHRVPIIESDVYGDLSFGPSRPRPLKAFDRTGWIMHCSSFSKTLAPGYRVGWSIPGRFHQAVERLKFAATVATPTLTQMAIAEYLHSGGYDRHLRRLRERIAIQVRHVTSAVTESFPSGTRLSRPAGGFLLWVEQPPRGVDGVELQRRALAQGISIAPGALFSPRERYRTCFRLSCGYPRSPAIDRGLRTLAKLLSPAMTR